MLILFIYTNRQIAYFFVCKQDVALDELLMDDLKSTQNSSYSILDKKIIFFIEIQKNRITRKLRANRAKRLK